MIIYFFKLNKVDRPALANKIVESVKEFNSIIASNANKTLLNVHICFCLFVCFIVHDISVEIKDEIAELCRLLVGDRLCVACRHGRIRRRHL